MLLGKFFNQLQVNINFYFKEDNHQIKNSNNFQKEKESNKNSYLVFSLNENEENNQKSIRKNTLKNEKIFNKSFSSISQKEFSEGEISNKSQVFISSNEKINYLIEDLVNSNQNFTFNKDLITNQKKILKEILEIVEEKIKK